MERLLIEVLGGTRKARMSHSENFRTEKESNLKAKFMLPSLIRIRVGFGTLVNQAD